MVSSSLWCFILILLILLKMEINLTDIHMEKYKVLPFPSVDKTMMESLRNVNFLTVIVNVIWLLDLWYELLLWSRLSRGRSYQLYPLSKQFINKSHNKYVWQNTHKNRNYSSKLSWKSWWLPGGKEFIHPSLHLKSFHLNLWIVLKLVQLQRIHFLLLCHL